MIIVFFLNISWWEFPSSHESREDTMMNLIYLPPRSDNHRYLPIFALAVFPILKYFQVGPTLHAISSPGTSLRVSTTWGPFLRWFQPCNHTNKVNNCGNHLVVRWLRPCTPNAGGLGLIPGQGTRSHVLQLKSRN